MHHASSCNTWAHPVIDVACLPGSLICMLTGLFICWVLSDHAETLMLAQEGLLQPPSPVPTSQGLDGKLTCTR